MNEPARIGAYELVEEIAQGGMAVIYRARKRGAHAFKREVCIKCIRPAFCNDRSFVEMFIDEAHTCSKLRHSNIVAIDDFGEVDGQLFSCMEWINGIDLANLERRMVRMAEPMPVDAGLFVVGEVLKALEYAHGKLDEGRPLEIVHRDVTPSNVMLSYAGEVKLADFGIARASSRLHQTHGDVVKGKTPYMAPEQARGLHLDGRVDLFALGVVAYELLAGRRPFVGERPSDIVMAIVRNERPKLGALRRGLGAEVEGFVDKLLETRREDRFSSATAALDALTAFAPGTGARALANLMSEHFPDHASIVRDGGLLRPKAITPPRPAAEVTVANPKMQAIPEKPAETLVPSVDGTDPSPPPDMPQDATAVDSPSFVDRFTPAERGVIERARTEPVATAVGPHATPPHAVSRDVPTVTTMQRVGDERAEEAPVVHAPKAPSAPPPKASRAPWLVAAVVPLAVGAVGLLATRRPTPDATPPDAPPPAVHAAQTPATTPAVVAPVVQPLGVADAGAAVVAPSDAAPATLTVVVRPWGAITIDGRSYGETRAVARLAPGRHRVQGAQGDHVSAEVVVLRAGERRQLTLTMP